MAKLHGVVRIILHEVHHYVHITYLSLVFIEAHGLYGIAAGVLGVIVVIDGHIERKQKRRAQQDKEK